MKKISEKISIILLLTVIFVVMGTIELYAATANVSVSSSSCSPGEETSITITVAGDENVAMVDLWVNYDSSVLEYVSGADVGGGGSLRFLSADNTTFTVKFKALNAGNSAITVNTSQSIISSLYTDSMTVSASNGSVTVKAPVTYSSDNNLSSLTISPGTLSPAFSKDVTTYNTSVPADCSRLAVSAVTSDSKAKISIWGAALDPGDNTTKITVTAEDGSQKVYVIYTKRPYEQATQGEKQTEPQTEAPKSDVVINIGGQDYFVVSNFDENVLPEGYEASEYIYKENEVVVGKGLSNGLTIFYLETAEDSGSVKAFFVYDEEKDEFTPLKMISSKSMDYTIITDEVTEAPEGYYSTELELNDDKMQVWIENTETPEYFIFYGMNVSGKKGWYQYDLTENTIQNAFILNKTISGGGETSDNQTMSSVEPESQPDNDYASLKSEYDNYALKMKLVILILVILLAAVIVILIIFIIKSFSHADEYDVTEDYDIEGNSEGIEAEDDDDNDDFTFIDIE